MADRPAPRPRLTLAQILAWADAFHARYGAWPTQRSGVIDGKLQWRTIDQALRLGLRGLPRGRSLAQLLSRERGVRVHGRRRLPLGDILAWADAYRAMHGDWPTQRSGPVEQMPDLTWAIVQQALVHGRHGLAGGSSLARLLRDRRGGRRAREPRRLSELEILACADAFHARHATWPNTRSGRVDAPANFTWSAVNRALRDGRHSLRGGLSLSTLLHRDRGAKRHLRTFLGRLGHRRRRRR